jgi:hypothetical protein
MRKATERPQTYDCRSSVKFDPLVDVPSNVILKLKSIESTKWAHNLGDGKASKRLVEDLLKRLADTGGFGTHKPEDYHVPVERSFQSDGLGS